MTPRIPLHLKAPQANYPATQRIFHQKNRVCVSGEYDKCMEDRRLYVDKFGLEFEEWIGEIIYESKGMDTLVICSGAEGIIMTFYCDPLTVRDTSPWKVGDDVLYSGAFIPSYDGQIYEENAIGGGTSKYPMFHIILYGMKRYLADGSKI